MKREEETKRKYLQQKADAEQILAEPREEIIGRLTQQQSVKVSDLSASIFCGYITEPSSERVLYKAEKGRRREESRSGSSTKRTDRRRQHWARNRRQDGSVSGMVWTV